MDKFDKAQVGDTLYDVKKITGLRWMTSSKFEWWPVVVRDISEKDQGRISCSWNGNAPKDYYRREFNKLRWKHPEEKK